MFWRDATFWAWIFLLSEWMIRLGMLAVVPLRRTPAAAKGWLLLIFFEPWVGLTPYFSAVRWFWSSGGSLRSGKDLPSNWPGC